MYGRKFVIQTNHQPLAYLKSTMLNTHRLSRWALKLKPFNFRVEIIS